MEQYLSLLMHILDNSGLFNSFETSTTKISGELKLSQQSVSRKLIEMQEKKLIKKENKGNVMIISLDDKGRDYLSSIYDKLKDSIKDPILKGKVKTGFGEGRYYMAMKEYQEKFLDKLGFKPFPGTFNIQIDIERANFFLSKLKPVVINGFKTKERSFGGLDCYMAKLNQEEIAIARPHRSNHPENILELLAPFNVRKKFGLKENDEVEVKI